MCNYSKVYVLWSLADIGFVCSDNTNCSDLDLRYAHVVHVDSCSLAVLYPSLP